MNYYSHHPKLLVSVDSIIFGFNENKHDLKLLLLKRNFQPEEGNWSLMGGFVSTDENLDDAAKRIVAQLTGFNACTWNNFTLLAISTATRAKGLFL